MEQMNYYLPSFFFKALINFIIIQINFSFKTDCFEDFNIIMEWEAIPCVEANMEVILSFDFMEGRAFSSSS